MKSKRAKTKALNIYITSRSEYHRTVKWNVNRRVCGIFWPLQATFYEITHGRRALRELFWSIQIEMYSRYATFTALFAIRIEFVRLMSTIINHEHTKLYLDGIAKICIGPDWIRSDHGSNHGSGFQRASSAGNGRSSRISRSIRGFCRVFLNWLMK